LALALFVLAVAVCLLAVSSPIDAAAYRQPADPGMRGPFKPNLALRSARVVGAGRLVGAEDVVIDASGRLYTGTADGKIVRVTLRPDGTDLLETYAATGGRPLGLRFGIDGKTLFVADANKGLLSVDPTGGVRTLATQSGGVPFRFTNDLDVAPDGTVYFSDASDRYGVDEYLYDLLEARPHGRLLTYQPDGSVKTLLDSLYFANGVALANDGSFVLVNETYRSRIRRFWLTGPRRGTSDVLVDQLPGFPDNLSRDPTTGRFWVALYTVRNRALDFLHPHPFLKNQLAKLPHFLWPKPEPYGMVFEMDADGHILRSLQDPGGERVTGVTSVEPWQGHLVLGSLYGPLAVWGP
jgi:sugar lactone lactonase YvrE